jgi:transketolase
MEDIIKKLSNRIVQISYEHKLSHISSCLTSLPIIYGIYNKKKDDERFVLSNGHAGLALYVVLEHFYEVDAEYLLEKHGIHPCFDEENRLDCSTGSLGLGLPIAVGFALANPDKTSYCLISDGESFEGSIWESLNFIGNKKISNLELHVNSNGYSAYDLVDTDLLIKKIKLFCPDAKFHLTNLNEYPLLKEKEMEAHYYVLRSEEEKNQLLLS